MLLASGAHKLGALRTVRPHVFAHTFRFSAHGFLALTKKSWFLEVPFNQFPPRFLPPFHEAWVRAKVFLYNSRLIMKDLWGLQFGLIPMNFFGELFTRESVKKWRGWVGPK